MEARTEKITVADGTFDLHLWLPESGRGPAVLLVQEIFGVGPYIRKVAEDLAALGYVVGAPDLFWRLRPNWVADHDEAGVTASLELSSRFDVPQGVADAAVALAYLGGLPEAHGGSAAVGFCLGGSIAYLLAATVEVDAVVSFYGSAVPDATGMLEKITCPLLLVFGGSDPYIPRERVAGVEAAAARWPNVETHVAEEAGHAFLNEAPRFHHPEAARVAWERAVEFLGRHVPAVPRT
ncbi:carboxymethylenebutenolidase [Streptosporangium becharense]|uniref:Carboxymethylenebutenolidase n=1 Tax=Streptosporangium becharense TaxID=1816182 RepID=A0A7W9IH25_9ACTN|nr:dienelactone hydrolase family protein [Streptosporangium becharense]MBB2912518.1 carboxymethylenebutenolidase [Streptosporangium becharense]MBB5820652.1 carboxymethylenebutenolidase [Streptosporangium becharense]